MGRIEETLHRHSIPDVEGLQDELDIIGSEEIDFFNGAIVETIDIDVIETGGVVELQLQQDGGGDLTCYFGGERIAFVTAPAKVTLTAGTDVAPALNYVYLTESGGVVTLAASDSGWPVVPYCPVATVLVQSAASLATDGAYKVHAWTDHISSTLSGHLAHLNAKFRSQHANWIDGCAAGDLVISNPNAYMSAAVGNVFQLHSHGMPAWSMPTDPAFIYNEPTTAYLRITSLASITQDAGGVSWATNRYGNLVLWGVVSEDAVDCQYYINLPDATYVTEASAIADSEATSIYTLPGDFVGTAFLVARYTVRKTASGWTQSAKSDLRGLVPASSVGGGQTSDHGLLAGLADDDHTQYVLADGTRNFTGEQAFDAAIVVAGGASGDHAALLGTTTDLIGKVQIIDPFRKNLVMGDTVADATDKLATVSTFHKTNAEEPVCMFCSQNYTSLTMVSLGGNFAGLNAATRVNIFCAANTTTTTGTEMARWTTAGLRLESGVSGNPAKLLDVRGDAQVTGDFLVDDIRPYTGSADFYIRNSAGVANFRVTDSGGVYSYKFYSITGAVPLYALTETDAGNQSWSMMSAGGSWKLLDGTASTYPVAVEPAAPTDSLRLKSDGDLELGADLRVDVINEKVADAGVTVEAVELKDGLVDGVDINTCVRILERSGTVQSTTNSVSVMTVFDYTVLADLMGTHSGIRVTACFKYNNNSGSNKIVRMKLYFGGTLYFNDADSIASAAIDREIRIKFEITNQNSASVQRMSGKSETGHPTADDSGLGWGDWNRAGSGTHKGIWGTDGAKDTTSNQNLKLDIYQQTTAASVVLEVSHYILEFLP